MLISTLQCRPEYLLDSSETPGSALLDGEKCDNMLCSDDECEERYVELKGSDVTHAIVQLRTTIIKLGEYDGNRHSYPITPFIPGFIRLEPGMAVSIAVRQSVARSWNIHVLLNVQTIHFQQEIEQADCQYSLFVTAGHNVVSDDNDFFEGVTDVCQRARLLHFLLPVGDGEC